MAVDMGPNRKKLLLIGVDQAIPYLLNKFLDNYLLPNINKLLENGVYTEAFPCSPCDTPINWTTIATGARTARSLWNCLVKSDFLIQLIKID